ncbi:MAG: oxidoreductase [Rhizobiales bacterium]|nr:oxidoreductase [Hyphomicrobiales bacterium]MBA68508.1 oxidoreductase [Hyphomicrobiales bacterium]
MALYRARPEDGVAWVTGASSGIGRQIALELAGAGYTVIATARREDELSSLAAETANLAGSAIPMPCDVTDEDAMSDLVAAIEARHGRIALAVFNAGMFAPVHGERMSVERFTKSFAVNVSGVIHGLVPTVALMQRTGRGQVVLMASVAGYAGLPTSAAYGATKAAVNNLAQSLKFDFDKMNIRIQVINPGFVDTPATEGNPFPMPALMQVEEAGKRVARGIAESGFEITFPRRFTWPLKLLSKLPYSLYFALVARGTGWKKKPLRPK